MKNAIALFALSLPLMALDAAEKQTASPSADSPQTNHVTVLSEAEMNKRHSTALGQHWSRIEECRKRRKEAVMKKLSLPSSLDRRVFPDREMFPDDFYNQEGVVTSAKAYGSYPEISTNLLLSMIQKYYEKDIDSREGRVRWHGEPDEFKTDTNRQCMVEFYPDGFVYVVPDPPKNPRFTYANGIYRRQFNRAKTTSERLSVIYDWAEAMTAEQLKAELEEVKKRRTVEEELHDEIDAPQKEYSQRREDDLKWKKRAFVPHGTSQNRVGGTRLGGIAAHRERKRQEQQKLQIQRKLQEQESKNTKQDTP